MECSHCRTLGDHALDAQDCPICDDCTLDRCMRCLIGDCEVETRDGDYICSDCYSHDIDMAYDIMKDRD